MNLYKEIVYLKEVYPSLIVKETNGFVSFSIKQLNRYLDIVVNIKENRATLISTLDGIYVLKSINIIDIEKEIEQELCQNIKNPLLIN